jgi:nucleoside-diphosphate-sugar epimerase
MIPIKGKRILLVGGAGFIGHNLAVDLVAKGAEVSIIDGLQVNSLLAFSATSKVIENQEFYAAIISQRLDMLKAAGVPVYVEDARDYFRFNLAFNQIRPQIVIHLAAVAHADISNKDPRSTFDHSLRTLENSLDSSRGQSSGVEQFIYFSSSMVYGDFKDGFVTEDSICEPKGIYGALKFAGEKMVIAYNQVFELPYTIIRPSALYGERCVSRRVGQIFIENAIKGSTISIRGNGEDRLDFTYIQDLIQGICRVIENENSKNQIFNLTYGEARSVRDMLNILVSHFPDVEVKYIPRDKLMPNRGTLSVEKAKRLIGYEPRNPLDVGFQKYISWYKGLARNGKSLILPDIDE